MKKNLAIPLAIYCLRPVFDVLTALVFLRPHARLIHFKLKAGTIILSLTMLTSCSYRAESQGNVASTLSDSSRTNKNVPRRVNDSVIDAVNREKKAIAAAQEKAKKDAKNWNHQPPNGRCYGAPGNFKHN